MIEALLSAFIGKDERPSARLAIVDDAGTVLQVVVAAPDWQAPEGAKMIPSGRANIGDRYDDARGGFPADLDYEEPGVEPERRLVPKRLIIDRLHAAGLLDIARKALDAADLYTRERWNARDAVFADDPESVAFLRLIGADPDVILAP